MPRRHERAGRAARPRVDVLVVAPRRPVDVPGAELERDVAGGVREIPADDSADVVPGRGDRRDVDELARQVVDAAQQDERDRSAPALELGCDVARAQRRLTLARPQPHDRRRRVEAVLARLRGDRVRVRGEGRVLDHDAIALGRRPVERGHQQVEVHGQRVHRHHFLRLRSDEARERRAQLVGRGQPGPLALEPALHGETGPGLELRRHRAGRRARLETQRVAGEVGPLAALDACPGRRAEIGPPRGVGRIARERLRLGEEIGRHGGHDTEVPAAAG